MDINEHAAVAIDDVFSTLNNNPDVNQERYKFVGIEIASSAFIAFAAFFVYGIPHATGSGVIVISEIVLYVFVLNYNVRNKADVSIICLVHMM
jgi:hypothetical protein